MFRTIEFGRSCDGASATEFALIMPVLLLILFSIIQFGIVLNNDIEIINGARATARAVAADRGSATPWTDGQNAFLASAPNISSATLAVLVNGSPCSSDGACQTLLSNAEGDAVTVTASLTCNLTILGVNYAPGCTLQSQTLERIE